MGLNTKLPPKQVAKEAKKTKETNQTIQKVGWWGMKTSKYIP